MGKTQRVLCNRIRRAELVQFDFGEITIRTAVLSRVFSERKLSGKNAKFCKNCLSNFAYFFAKFSFFRENELCERNKNDAEF